MNGYTAMVSVEITAEAQMLESVAGLDAEGVTREFAFALGGMTDTNDPASLRWLACLCARRLDDLSAGVA